MILWKPDTACYNSRGETNLDAEDKIIHSVMKLFPNGRVYYSRKYVSTNYSDNDNKTISSYHRGPTKLINLLK